MRKRKRSLGLTTSLIAFAISGTIAAILLPHFISSLRSPFATAPSSVPSPTPTSTSTSKNVLPAFSGIQSGIEFPIIRYGDSTFTVGDLTELSSLAIAVFSLYVSWKQYQLQLTEQQPAPIDNQATIDLLKQLIPSISNQAANQTIAELLKQLNLSTSDQTTIDLLLKQQSLGDQPTTDQGTQGRIASPFDPRTSDDEN